MACREGVESVLRECISMRGCIDMIRCVSLEKMS